MMKTQNQNVQELSKHEFEEFIAEGTVFVDFFAEWCMPCLMMAPVVDELSEKFKGKIKFAKVNIDDNHDLAQKLKVVSIPNMIVFQDGKPVGQFIGAMNSDDLEEKLKRFVK